MAISTDWQLEVGSLTLGASDTYELVDFDGWGGAPIKGQDWDRQQRDGAICGSDYNDKKTLLARIQVTGSTAANAGTNLRSLVAAWQPATAETTLDIRFPGTAETVMRFYGKPRGCRVGSIRNGEVGKFYDVLVTFVAHDPLMYGASVVSTTNAGNAPTDRVTITVTGSGGTPSLTNTSDSSGQIVWNTTLAGAATRIINLRDRTVVDGSSVDKRSEILNSSTWFRLAVGANTINTSGLTSISVSNRPAYY